MQLKFRNSGTRIVYNRGKTVRPKSSIVVSAVDQFTDIHNNASSPTNITTHIIRWERTTSKNTRETGEFNQISSGVRGPSRLRLPPPSNIDADG